MHYTRGSPTGTYYKRCAGADDPMKTKVNKLDVTEGTARFPDVFDLNSIGSWVTEDPLNYCYSEWNTLLSRMTQKVYSAQDNALLLADLVFARSTMDVAIVYARKALKLARALTKPDVKAIKFYFSKYNSEYGLNRKGRRVYHKALTELPEAWLTMSFVLNPLMSSVKSSIDVWNNPLIWREVPFSAGSLSRSYKKQWGYWGDQRLESFVIRSTGKGYCRFKNPNQYLVQSLGMTDILGTIWDVIPWSWAVDYFVNVSDYINHLNPRYKSVEWDRAYFGFKITRSTTLEIANPALPDNYYSGKRYSRYPGVPGSVSFDASFDLTLDQFANLSSALALTLSRKFAMKKD